MLAVLPQFHFIDFLHVKGFFCYRSIEVWGSQEALQREIKKRQEEEQIHRDSKYHFNCLYDFDFSTDNRLVNIQCFFQFLLHLCVVFMQ